VIPDAVWRKFHLGFLLFAATAAVIAAIFYGPSLLSRWVAGPAFNHMISRTISHALKVDGQLGRIESQPDLSVTVEGFSAQGWPGQAIGSMESGPARAWFDPTAILRGEWRLPLIRVDRAELRVINHDNKLKALDPVIPPKPWYANLLPSRFSCGWIDCANAGIELPVGTQAARCTNLRLGANSVGKDFQYFGRHLPWPSTLSKFLSLATSSILATSTSANRTAHAAIFRSADASASARTKASSPRLN
jgi:hypothetical protein